MELRDNQHVWRRAALEKRKARSFGTEGGFFLYKFWLLRRSYPRQQRFLRPPDLPSKGMLVVLPSPSFVVTRSGVVKLFLTFSFLPLRNCCSQRPYSYYGGERRSLYIRKGNYFLLFLFHNQSFLIKKLLGTCRVSG